MHPSRPATAWLLALALIAGQWLLVAHDAQHSIAKAHQCQLCFHHAAQDLIDGGEALAVVLPLAYAVFRPVLARLALTRTPRAYRARAPPVLA